MANLDSEVAMTLGPCPPTLPIQVGPIPSKVSLPPLSVYPALLPASVGQILTPSTASTLSAFPNSNLVNHGKGLV